MHPSVRQVVLGNLGRYDTDARALFAAINSTPTPERKAQINTLIVALKAAGVWTLLDILYVHAAADSQAARLNWKNPATFTAVPVSSPTFVADRGYTGDGAAARLRTQYTPSTNAVLLTQNNASAWVWSLTDSQSVSRELGNGSSPQIAVSTRNASNLATFLANENGVGSTVANTDSRGFFGTQRVGANSKLGWKNGVAILPSTAVASSGLPTQEQWICGANSASFSSKQIAAAAWGASLDTREAAFYSAMLTYMQSVGAA